MSWFKMSWFKRVGWFYVPTSGMGVIITLMAFIFCAQIFIAADRNSHSASDTLYRVFPFFVCTFLMLDWIAVRTCHRVEA